MELRDASSTPARRRRSMGWSTGMLGFVVVSALGIAGSATASGDEPPAIESDAQDVVRAVSTTRKHIESKRGATGAYYDARSRYRGPESPIDRARDILAYHRHKAAARAAAEHLWRTFPDAYETAPEADGVFVWLAGELRRSGQPERAAEIYRAVRDRRDDTLGLEASEGLVEALEDEAHEAFLAGEAELAVLPIRHIRRVARDDEETLASLPWLALMLLYDSGRWYEFGLVLRETPFQPVAAIPLSPRATRLQEARAELLARAAAAPRNYEEVPVDDPTLRDVVGDSGGVHLMRDTLTNQAVLLALHGRVDAEMAGSLESLVPYDGGLNPAGFSAAVVLAFRALQRGTDPHPTVKTAIQRYRMRDAAGVGNPSSLRFSADAAVTAAVTVRTAAGEQIIESGTFPGAHVETRPEDRPKIFADSQCTDVPIASRTRDACLSAVTHIRQQLGTLDGAREVYLTQVALRAFGLESSHALALLYNEAGLELEGAGDFEGAERLYRAGALTLDTPRPATGSGKSPSRKSRQGLELTRALLEANLAANLMHQGAFTQAEKHFAAAEALLPASAPRALEAGLALNRGALLSERRDTAGAHDVIWPACVALSDVPFARCIHTLARNWLVRDDLTLALLLFEEARIASSDDPTLHAEVLNDIGDAHRRAGRLDQARAAYDAALEIRQQALPEDHPHLAVTRANLGLVALARGELDDAARLLDGAREALLSSLEPTHPLVAEVDFFRARTAEMAGDAPRALELQRQTNTTQIHNLELIVQTGSRRQRADYIERLDASVDATLRLHREHLPQDPDATRAALEIVLARKARLLDAEAARWATLRATERADGELDEATRQQLDALAALTARRANLTLRGEPSDAPTVASLEQRIEALEAELGVQASASTDTSKPDTLPSANALAERLPERGLLLEIVATDLSTPRPDLYGEELKRHGAGGERVYVALAVDPTGRIRTRTLGSVKEIDSAVRTLRACLMQDAACSAERAESLARDADRLVMRPLWSVIPSGTRHLVIAPDGALNLLPFGALRDDTGRYLIQSFVITLVASGRDLLRSPTARSGDRLALFAAPDYAPEALVGDEAKPADAESTDAGDAAPAGQRAAAGSTLAGPWSPLAGTVDEAADIERIFERVDSYSASDASEAQLRGIRRPWVLHVATHGFFLDATAAGETRSGSAATRSSLLSAGAPSSDEPVESADWGNDTSNDDPLAALDRSGLVLAGADGLVGDGEHDGILTASEVAMSLDLRGTRLVTLSACETGLGEVVDGEGVFGLRRAFTIAGAESQVISLWKVDDAGTRALMQRMYARLEAGEGRHEALRHAQLSMLAEPEYAHPYYWSAFVASGDWRTLDGDAPPEAKRYDSVAAVRAELHAPGACRCGALRRPSSEGSTVWLVALLIGLGVVRVRRGRSGCGR